MAFDPELNSAYDDGIEAAVQTDCGFRVIRLDRIPHNENINDKILADIRASQFVVADFTKHKSGVYFEAGFALRLGRNVGHMIEGRTCHACAERHLGIAFQALRRLAQYCDWSLSARACRAAATLGITPVGVGIPPGGVFQAEALFSD